MASNGFPRCSTALGRKLHDNITTAQRARVEKDDRDSPEAKLRMAHYEARDAPHRKHVDEQKALRQRNAVAKSKEAVMAGPAQDSHRLGGVNHDSQTKRDEAEHQLRKHHLAVEEDLKAKQEAELERRFPKGGPGSGRWG